MVLLCVLDLRPLVTVPMVRREALVVVVPGIVSMLHVSVSVSKMESLTVELVMGVLVDSVDCLSRSDPLTFFNVTMFLVESPLTRAVGCSVPKD